MNAEAENTKKARWDLLPLLATSKVVDAFTYGARKYEPHGWRGVADWRDKYFAATLRHLTSWQLGERTDPESGLHHLAHAAADILILLSRDELNQ